MPADPLTDTLARFGSGLLADALDQLGLHVNSTGGLRCLAGGNGAIAGYAATARIRTANAPVLGRALFRHTDWWAAIRSLPEPCIVVLEDMDEPAGYGACAGEVEAATFLALGCRGAVTNGSGRDTGPLSTMGFALFAPGTAPSRAYAHLVEHSVEVEIFGLRVRPGDLLVADANGVISIPKHDAARLCAAASGLLAQRKKFVDYCASGAFSIAGMEEQLRQIRS